MFKCKLNCKYLKFLCSSLVVEILDYLRCLEQRIELTFNYAGHMDTDIVCALLGSWLNKLQLFASQTLHVPLMAQFCWFPGCVDFVIGLVCIWQKEWNKRVRLTAKKCIWTQESLALWQATGGKQSFRKHSVAGRPFFFFSCAVNEANRKMLQMLSTGPSQSQIFGQSSINQMTRQSEVRTNSLSDFAI